jgi:P-type Cu2+ transporter
MAVMAQTGRGVEGVVDGARYRIGREDFVEELVGSPLPVALRPVPGDTRTPVFLGGDTGWLAILLLEDETRPHAREALQWMASHGLALGILSGDAPQTVKAFAEKLGVANAAGGLSPQDKHAAIEALQAQGHVVAMVGDGVNDAPVLAKAHVSIAMGEGTELARTHADIVLLGGQMMALTEGIVLARRTLKIIRQNLYWSFGYNFLAIPLAVAGWVTPWMAGIGMSASSLFVVLNALRLQRGRSARE